MKPRSQNRTLPNHPPYFECMLEGRGMHWLRAPSHAQLAQLISVTQYAPLAVVAMAASEDFNTQLAMFHQAGDEIGELAGALIGFAWFHESLDLDTHTAKPIRPPGKRPDYTPYCAYGAAVYEELHEAGYTLQEIAGMLVAILGTIAAATSVSDEVVERATFLVNRLTTTSASSAESSTEAAIPEA